MMIIVAGAEWVMAKAFGGAAAEYLITAAVDLLPLTYLNVLIPVVYYSLRVVKRKNAAAKNLS